MRVHGKGFIIRGFVILLAVLMLVTGLPSGIATAHAAETAPVSSEESSMPETEPTPTPEPTEEPASSQSQPMDVPEPTETPQPTQEPSPTGTPEPIETMPPLNESGIIEVNGAQCVSDEIIVKFKDSVADSTVETVLESVDSEVQEEVTVDNLVVSAVPENETVEDFIETVEDLPSVEYAEPNYIYTMDAITNDPGLSQQYYLTNIGIYDAWDVSMGSANVKVAILDSGIDTDHPDLAGTIYAQHDYVNNDERAEDDEGHGTMVAGVIAGNANNGRGIVGIAPGVKLIIAKVIDSRGYAKLDNVINGINYAVNSGADVINMSFGGYLISYAMEEAIDKAVAAGAVCVGAAGNDSTSQSCYPADYESCISVIATDEENIITYFSNYGNNKDIAAPGYNIVTTYMGGGYASVGGTSFSSPIVAAVAALMLSIDPTLTVDEVKSILYGTASYYDDQPSSWHYKNYYGNGNVNAGLAVIYVAGTKVFKSGTGTSWDPYVVSTPGQLYAMRFDPDAYYSLVTDIDLTLTTQWTSFYNNGYGWQPIDDFLGHFDGNGHSITGLYSCVGGLFDVVGIGGAIQRVNMRNCSIDAGVGDGGIANENKGSISYCSVDGVISGDSSIGGIVGDNRGTVFACANLSTVTAKYFIGGIAGCSWSGSISNCYNKGAVTASSTYNKNDAGGIVGFCSSTTLSNCFNEGKVKAYDTIWGSIAGYSLNDINNCYTIANEGLNDTVCGYIPYDSVVNCFLFDPTTVNGIDQMRRKTSFTGFDFVNVWTMEEGKTFPTLRAVPYTHATGMSLSAHTLKIMLGQSKTLTAAVSPSTAYNPRVVWTSSDPSVATVNNGTVTLLKDGMAVITAQTLDGAFVDTCQVQILHTYTINAYSSNTASGTVTGGGAYTEDAVVTLRATPRPGYRFTGWSNGEATVSNNAVYQLTATADTSVTALFSPIGTPVLSAASTGYSSTQLSWSAVEGASGYEVWRKSGSGFTKINTVSGTSYSDAGLTAGTAYCYYIKAYCYAATVTTYGLPSGNAWATPVPMRPNTANASIAGYNSVKVSWSSVPGASGYELRRATTQNGTYSSVKSTSSLSYTNTSLATGTTYYYKVRAYRMVGRTKVYGTDSAIVSAKPMLSAVTGVSALAYNPTSVKISWSSVAGRTKYEVWRSTSPTTGFVKIKSTSSTTYKDTTCTPFVTYYYRIKVYRTVGGKPIYSASDSPTANARPILGNVMGVRASAGSPSSVKLSWSSVSGCSGYEIRRSASANGPYTAIKTVSGKSYTDSNLTPNTTYYYQVVAYRKAGSGKVYSTPCEPVSGKPVFGSVTNPKAVRSSATKIKLTWSAVSGRKGYVIYRSTDPNSGFLQIKSTTSTSFTDSGLAAGVTYYYKVQAYLKVGNSDYYTSDSMVVSMMP